MAGERQEDVFEVGLLGPQVAEVQARGRPLETTVRALLGLALRLNDSSKLHAVLYTEAERTPAIRASLAELDEELVRFLAAQLDRTGRGCGDPVRRARLVVAAADAAIHVVVLRLPPEERAGAVEDLADLMLRGLLRAA